MTGTDPATYAPAGLDLHTPGRREVDAAMTSTRASQLIVLLGLAEACWVLTVQQMRGMDTGAATELGSLGFFAAVWVPMMAAMMLPGAVPAVSRLGGALAVPFFGASYLAVWTLVGLVLHEVAIMALGIAVTADL